MVILKFGDLHPETVTLRSFGSHTFLEAERDLSMDFAAWRCSRGSEMLCSSSSPNGVGGPMEVGLRGLERKSLIRSSLAPVTMDLRLEFTEGLAFEVFCDQVDEQQAHDNYSFRSKNGYFIVGPASKLRLEAHGE